MKDIQLTQHYYSFTTFQISQYSDRGRINVSYESDYMDCLPKDNGGDKEKNND